MQPSEIIRRNFQSKDGELTVGELRISEIADRFGTPLFVYDASILDRNFRRLRSALPREFSIFYSVKANPNRAILKIFLALGCGLEIASVGEYFQARSAGCEASNIVFAGPGKTEAELLHVLRNGIGEIHLESKLEAERVARIAHHLGVVAPVGLRINPTSDAEGGAMRMGGKPAPFGIDEECVDILLEQVCSTPSLNFRGIHLFAGTQILDASILLSQYRKGIELGRRVAERTGHPLHTIDFGGGLGIPYFAADQELDLDHLRTGVEELMNNVRQDRWFQGTRFLVEPGRFLVGESGIYVARVNDIKVSRGKKFLILDGGMNHHLAASGNLGQTIKRNFPSAIVNKMDSPATEMVDVVGPLCTPLDMLARGAELPNAEIGSLFAVFQSGAYARAASPLGFLSHVTPPEVLVQGRNATLVRSRGECEDYVRDITSSSF